MTTKIGIIVGSLRKDSWNRKLALQLIQHAPSTLSCEFIEIGQLALYNQDLDANPPQEWVTFREQILKQDGILFVTAEYNRSVPGVLKNAIDVGSRPYGKSAWNGKPTAVVSSSPGAIGGFGANHHLRQSLVFLNMPCLQFEAYIGSISNLFDAEGKIAKSETGEFLSKIMGSFSQWVEKNK